MVPFSTLFPQGNHFDDLAFADDQQFEDFSYNWDEKPLCLSPYTN